MKEGGQALLGGLDALVSRNFFGAQADSFEATLPPPECLEPFLAAAGSVASENGGSSSSPGFRAVFIRAPAVLETGPGVEVLAELELTDEQVEAALRSRAAGSGNSGGGSGPAAAAADAAAPSIPRRVAVAVRQGNLLATSFHPELTDDSRWHALFAESARESAKARRSGSGSEKLGESSEARASVVAADAASSGACKSLGRRVQLPADLPVLAPGQKY
jgi:5'-phosphate synthase pdxT subunit